MNTTQTTKSTELEQPETTTTTGPMPVQAHVHGPNCNHGHHHHPVLRPLMRSLPKVGRNDPCTCGSNLKFKKCCGLKG